MPPLSRVPMATNRLPHIEVFAEGALHVPIARLTAWLPACETPVFRRGDVAVVEAGRTAPSSGTGAPVHASNLSHRTRQQLTRLRTFAVFLILALHGVQHMAHGYRLAEIGREECGSQGDIADVTAAQGELACQRHAIDVGCERDRRGPDAFPDAGAGSLVGKWKMDAESQSADERLVQFCRRLVARIAIPSNTLPSSAAGTQFQCWRTGRASPNFRALAEQGIRLIEEENGIGILRRDEDAVEILFGFADVFADYAGEIDLVGSNSVLWDDLDGHRLAGTRGSRKQRGDAGSQGQLALESPVFEDVAVLFEAMAHLA